MQFDGLACLTGLRVLSLSPLVPDDRQLQELSAIAEALPKLQHLSQLRLRGPAAQDMVLQSIKDLTGLSQLVLEDACCSEDSLQRLPATLQRLVVRCRDPSSAAGLSISPHSTPGFCMKTLHLDSAGMFDTSVLTDMPQLCTLWISATPLTAPAGQGRFQGAPELSDIRLGMEGIPRDIIAPLIPEEAAALTASTSLSRLELSDDYMDLAPEPWHALFPPGRQLRALVSFTAGTWLLSDPEAMQRMTACCPQLTALSFICCTDLQDPEDIVEPGVVATGLQHLTTIPSLQRLTIVHEELPIDGGVVNALAALTHLTNLRLVFEEDLTVYALMEGERPTVALHNYNMLRFMLENAPCYGEGCAHCPPTCQGLVLQTCGAQQSLPRQMIHAMFARSSNMLQSLTTLKLLKTPLRQNSRVVSGTMHNSMAQPVLSH